MKELNFIINRGLTDNNSRKLIISEDFLKFENKDIVNDTFTTFNKNEIVEYRFGMKWISFKVTFGREYLIFIKTKENKILKINFKTYFGRKKKQYHKKYGEILEALWNCYFKEIIENYIERHKNGEDFYIGEVFITKESIKLNANGILKQNKVEIPWEKIRTSNYHTYFMIYSEENPSNINRGFNYLNDWNTGILYSFIRTLLREKGIETYNK